MAARKRNIHRGPFQNKAAFEARLNEWISVATRYFGDLPEFDLVYFPKARTAGFWRGYRTVSGLRHALEFNVEAIENHFDDMVENTIPHELAHMIDYHLHGRSSGHGKHWQSIMLRLGVRPDRTHSMELSKARKTRKFRYVAECGTEIWVSTQRHNKLQRGYRLVITRTNGKLAREHFTGQVKISG